MVDIQANKLDVIVCATVAAKEGITLTSTDTVLFVEEMDSTMGRASRR